MKPQFVLRCAANGRSGGRIVVVGGILITTLAIVALIVLSPSEWLTARESRLSADDLRDIEIPDRLRGFEALCGSADAGFEVLTERAECLDCHSIDSAENNGYPNLADVGIRLTARQIVSSIVEPSREIAAGYRSVAITTLDGRSIQGVIVEHKSSSQTLCVRTCCGEVLLDADEIDEQRTANSAMPEGLVDQLTPQEFADLVEFLCNLGIE